ncbi:hypothetical protein [Ignicoccus hospitalis]|uniref:NarG-like domain-containing protein n=1 Tax=Ignicoccus hospitalis (strain KIN4/I / DSM 18386 / JCM 14125) TaxID=453591 RepID=A8AC92_IGNH4|nr:hypothetical protein [Ignicoccus hospitalis]ABU82544.1 hypothetical protein Igni_1368 [Ignicoccus hospitalis KIN4/I]HIH90709.1 hypothetical protein [Desulfurococcaceae archaeon]
MTVGGWGSPSDLFNFAVYYLLIPSVFVFSAGFTYRIVKMILNARIGPAQKGHNSFPELVKGLIMTFIRPILFSAKTRPDDFVTGLVFLHIIGVIPLLFLMGEHIAFWVYYVPGYINLWPFNVPLSMTTAVLTVTSPITPSSNMAFAFVNTIWGPLTVVLNGDLMALLVLIAIGYKCALRLTEIVLKHNHTPARIGDFVAYALLFLIVFFGYAAARHWPSSDVVTYRNVLGLHVLFAELLLMYIPFSKYWHFVFGYWYGKLHEWYDLDVKRGEAI